MSILILAVIVLVSYALFELMKVYTLTQSLKGNKEEEVSNNENKNQANYLFLFMLGYFAFFVWLVVKYGKHLLPVSGSVHGEKIDLLLDVNFAVIILAFILTHILLFWFARQYYSRPGHKAVYITHSNKLELIWTIVPAIVLAFIIIYGLATWNEITDEPENPIVVELYSKQFDWTARYAGMDGELGAANYRLISLVANNPLGIITSNTINAKIEELDNKIEELNATKAKAFPGGKIDAQLDEEIAKAIKHKNIVSNYLNSDLNLNAANDDVITKVEFRLPVDRAVKFLIRAQDVIHSAYMPHFRAQMNAVPGAVTTFSFIPNKTTAEMKEITGNPDFEYLLYCNKICGAAHYNMKMTIIVETEEEFNAWMAQQKTFSGVQVSELSKNTGISVLANN
jgi:cytochrome c oxidase subunit 2